IEFSKIGPISFISHLDLQKIMARIFKRSQIEVLYSEGYKSRPLISFGPALTLGISSLREFFDVRVPKEWDNTNEILELLEAHSEKGIHFKSIKKIETNETSIQDSAKAFTYYIQLKDNSKRDELIDKVKNSSELIVKSFSKKTSEYTSKDIRHKIIDIYPGKLEFSEDILNVIDEVSPCLGEGIFIKTHVDQGSSIRPIELVQMMTELGHEVEKPIKASIELI